MSYAIFGDSYMYVTRLADFTDHKLQFRQQKCAFYGVPGMSTKWKYSAMFDRLCANRPR